MSRPMKPTAARATMASATIATAAVLAVAPTTAESQVQAPQSAPTAAKHAASFTVTRVRRNVVAGRRVLVTGHLRASGGGKDVALQARRGSGRWSTVARDVTSTGGAYRLRYTPGAIGTYATRITFAGDKTTRSARHAVASVNVFRKVLVSWYGGGVGACGTGHSYAYGVANKTLPCGTKVRLRYRGRSVTARVVDRGPYVSGREYDLLPATKNALGAGDLTTVMATR